MRKTLIALALFAGLTLALVAASLAPAVSAGRQSFPPLIALPDNFGGEGVAIGNGHQIFAGSLADGAIYQADLRTGEGGILVPGQAGRLSVGMSYDERSGYLFVGGGFNGVGRVYDTESGALLAEYGMFSGGQFGDFINDVIVTREAAYFTNSFAPVMYRVPLGPGGALMNQSAAEEIELTGDWNQVPGSFVFNANGIEASQNGKHLLIVNTQAETLYRVDPVTGEASAVDLGSYALANGDGLVLVGRTLYVVQNQLNQIAEFQLANDFLSGELTDVITDGNFRVPTTAAAFGKYLYAVNARFGQDLGADPTFEIVQVER